MVAFKRLSRHIMRLHLKIFSLPHSGRTSQGKTYVPHNATTFFCSTWQMMCTYLYVNVTYVSWMGLKWHTSGSSSSSQLQHHLSSKLSISRTTNQDHEWKSKCYYSNRPLLGIDTSDPYSQNQSDSNGDNNFRKLIHDICNTSIRIDRQWTPSYEQILYNALHFLRVEKLITTAYYPQKMGWLNVIAAP